VKILKVVVEFTTTILFSSSLLVRVLSFPKTKFRGKLIVKKKSGNKYSQWADARMRGDE
jgi:hypothetical protein